MSFFFFFLYKVCIAVQLTTNGKKTSNKRKQVKIKTWCGEWKIEILVGFLGIKQHTQQSAHLRYIINKYPHPNVIAEKMYEKKNE